MELAHPLLILAVLWKLGTVPLIHNDILKEVILNFIFFWRQIRSGSDARKPTVLIESIGSGDKCRPWKDRW